MRRILVTPHFTVGLAAVPVAGLLYVACSGASIAPVGPDASADAPAVTPDAARDVPVVTTKDASKPVSDVAADKIADVPNVDAAPSSVWTASPFPQGANGMTNPLFAVWGSDSSDVWAVGGFYSAQFTSEYETGVGETILHWDGGAWTTSTTASQNPLYGVWGSGPNDVWAVGGFHNIGPGSSGSGTIEHWNGKAWSLASVATMDVLYGVWGTQPSDVWAVGGFDAGTGGRESAILHWDGDEWSPAPVPTSAGGAMGPLTAVWGSGPNDVWAVGTAILHYNGTGWTISSPMGASAVWGTGPTDAWAVGDTGTILHWDGGGWYATQSGTSTDFRGIWGSGPTDVWAVGGDLTTLQTGSILHWDGRAWSVSPTIAAQGLFGVWGSAYGVWSVGGYSLHVLEGTILHHTLQAPVAPTF